MAAIRKMIPFYLAILFLAAGGALLASRSVSVLADAFTIPTSSPLPTVVVDAGHGGEDGGAAAPNGTKESVLNLEISLRVRDALRFLGLPVVMVRENDVSVCDPEAATVSEKKVSDLKNRVRLVGETPNAILLSIHQNMFSESQYHGAQVFYAGASGSREMAECMQELLRTALDPANHRQSKQANTVYLLNKIHCPGILVECGFLSNPEEEALLETADYQKKLAAAIAAGLIQAWKNAAVY